MSFFDVLKWFFEVAGINKRKIVLLLAILLLSNVILYYSYHLAKLIISHPTLLKIVKEKQGVRS
jgi:hypothetical protein